MTPRLKTQAISLSLLLTAIALVVSAESGMLARRPSKWIPDRKTIKHYALHIAVEEHIPIGLEISSQQPETGFFDVASGANSIESNLNSFTRAHPAYQWKREGGVVDIYPRKTSIFDVLIDNVEFQDRGPSEMINALLQDSNILRYAHQHRIKVWFLIAGSPPTGHQASIVIKRETLRCALNRVVISTGQFGWCTGPEHNGRRSNMWLQLW